MAFFPRFVANEFAPVFRLFDEFATHAAVGSRNNSFGVARSSFRSFQPRFDVKETHEGYVLHGEMPGVEQKDLDIQITDANTLSIKGRTEQVREEGRRPSSAVEAQPEPSKITKDESESESTGYHKATVEDEATATASGASSEAVEPPAATPTEIAQAPTEQSRPDQSRYWLSERSVGEFSRSFRFPSRVDQDHVKASLKNGILSILIPKAAAPVSRRINVE